MVEGSRAGSWYLDPMVALQKRTVHRQLVHGWSRGLEVRNFLKTDLFEEANGADDILFDLFPPRTLSIGMDIEPETVVAAARRSPNASCRFLVSDVRSPALKPGSLDLIVSTSTLDHLRDAGELKTALRKFAGLLRPGGRIIVTMDNLDNPLYRPLRWASQRGWIPFRMGYTVSLGGLTRVLEEVQLEVVAREYVLHNPRIVSTLLFLGLRRLCGRWADRPVGALLWIFSQLGRLPTRRWSACFVAACAQAPPTPR